MHIQTRMPGKYMKVPEMNDQSTKMLIRKWLKERQTASVPPPDIDQIRREMGWDQARMERGIDTVSAGAVVNSYEPA